MLTSVIRFSERDILMRYHWGLGVGHFHAHQPTGRPSHNYEESDTQYVHSPECENEVRMDENDVNTCIQDENSDVCDSDDPELDLEDREHEGWDDVESEDDLEDTNFLEEND